jgi:hypothetical protein
VLRRATEEVKPHWPLDDVGLVCDGRGGEGDGERQRENGQEEWNDEWRASKGRSQGARGQGPCMVALGDVDGWTGGRGEARGEAQKCGEAGWSGLTEGRGSRGDATVEKERVGNERNGPGRTRRAENKSGEEEEGVGGRRQWVRDWPQDVSGESDGRWARWGDGRGAGGWAMGDGRWGM